MVLWLALSPSNLLTTSSNPGQETAFFNLFFLQNDKFFTVHYLDWCSEWPLDYFYQ